MSANTTSRLEAIQDEGAAASTRIKRKSQEMRKFHRNIRKRIEADTDPPPVVVVATQDLAKAVGSG